MFWRESGEVVNSAIDHDPAVLLGGVLGDLIDGDFSVGGHVGLELVVLS
jgi:hypothetical protein